MSSSPVPVLESARLRLRAHTSQDLAKSVSLWTDPGVYRFIGNETSSESHCWWRMLSYAGLWSLLGYGYWLVEEKVSGAFVGELGFADFCREISPPLRGVPEAGWALVPSMHGKGYASEALALALHWLDQQPFGQRSVCMIDPDNLASRRVAEKSAYRVFTRTRFRDAEIDLFERLRP